MFNQTSINPDLLWINDDDLPCPSPLLYPPPLSESVVSEMQARTKFCYKQAITSCKYPENPRGYNWRGGEGI
jgi:hypothetical protein